MKQKSNLISRLKLPAATLLAIGGLGTYLVKNDPIGRISNDVYVTRSLDDFGGYARHIPDGELQPLRGRGSVVGNETRVGESYETGVTVHRSCGMGIDIENFDPRQIEHLEPQKYELCHRAIVEEGRRRNFP